MIGKIQRVPIKEVWKNEAFDFTPWLRDNIDILNDILSFSLSSAESEQSAGSFSVDIVAEDESGNPVIIENQFGKSDHDHLGKLLTYLTVIESKTAIWIVENPRPEHISTISWLNESSSASFYLIKVEAVQIDDSKPAPLFTLIVGPSEESRQAGVIKKDIAERYFIRHRFWSVLLNISKEKTKLHANISPSQHNWIGTNTKGLGFNYGIRQHDSQVERDIDRSLFSSQIQFYKPKIVNLTKPYFKSIAQNTYNNHFLNIENIYFDKNKEEVQKMVSQILSNSIKYTTDVWHTVLSKSKMTDRKWSMQPLL